MKPLIVDAVVGARPNFVKMAALFAVREEFPGLRLRLVHTGQHYDPLLSEVFFRELALPAPDVHLGAAAGPATEQTARIVSRYGAHLRENRPGLCLVVGDVTSTLACALAAAQEGVPVAHVEAGLRSFDRSMPEEINRVLTDQLAEFLFASEPAAVENLAREGRPKEKIHIVGNLMIDTLLRMRPKALELHAREHHGLKERAYAFATLHRASNVDAPERLAKLCDELSWLSGRMPLLFAVHPRTRKRLQEFDLERKLIAAKGVHLCEPLPYLEALSLVLEARVVVTDSGGLQEETTALGVPCLTLRENTERPITVERGMNTLIRGDWALFRRRVEEIVALPKLPETPQIEGWDGHAAERVLKVLSRGVS